VISLITGPAPRSFDITFVGYRVGIKNGIVQIEIQELECEIDRDNAAFIPRFAHAPKRSLPVAIYFDPQKWKEHSQFGPQLT
jgi:hypothetical protein